jgi:hypothetical protein
MNQFVNALKISANKMKGEKVTMLVRKTKWEFVDQIIDPTETQWRKNHNESWVVLPYEFAPAAGLKRFHIFLCLCQRQK